MLDTLGRNALANVHLGHLAYDAEGGRFRPAVYIARPKPKPTGTASRATAAKAPQK